MSRKGKGPYDGLRLVPRPNWQRDPPFTYANTATPSRGRPAWRLAITTGATALAVLLMYLVINWFYPEG